MIFYTYFFTVALSFICSLIAFRLHYPSQVRLISILLGITLGTEIFANFLRKPLNLHTNFPIYTIFMLVEYFCIALFFKQVIMSLRVKKVIDMYFFFFPVFWASTIVFVFGFNGWNSYVIIVGDLFNICISARYLYELFTDNKLLDFKRSAEFWIAVGIFFYSCCELPITGMLNFWAHNYASVAVRLYGVLQVLNIIMYLIFIYAFLCPIRTSTTK